MSLSIRKPHGDIYSLAEIARAANVSVAHVEALAARGEIATVGSFPGSTAFVRWEEAVEAVRTLSQPMSAESHTARPPQLQLYLASGQHRSAGLPIVFSTLVHASIVAGAIVLASVGMAPAVAQDNTIQEVSPMRLVYIATPGPGGGGGGGGLKHRLPPPKAERKGKARLSSPLPPRKEPDPIVAVPKPPEPPPVPLKTEPLPAIVAPVATQAANDRDRAGVLEQTTAKNDSRGPGAGGGVGTGSGTGIGEGSGSGIGPGEGGGTGGGPYRPGSGIAPPRLLREVKPDYTEEARQHGVEGEVLLEIVVRRDGSVGDIRVVQGLGYGLNNQATTAVRQWRFAPAQRRGTPVDILVEVAVEFKLR